jgi:hypothetical protein
LGDAVREGLGGDRRDAGQTPSTNRVGEPTIVPAGVIATRGRLVTTATELVRDRDRPPIATASATFLNMDADTEAIWRARYLRDSEGAAAELRETPLDVAEA